MLGTIVEIKWCLTKNVLERRLKNYIGLDFMAWNDLKLKKEKAQKHVGVLLFLGRVGLPKTHIFLGPIKIEGYFVRKLNGVWGRWWNSLMTYNRIK